MTLTRNPALYFWFALSGSVHLGLILFFLGWSTTSAYHAIQKIEVAFVNSASPAAPQVKLQKKTAFVPETHIPKPAEDVAPVAAPVAPTVANANVTQEAIAGTTGEALQEYERYAQEVAMTLNRNKVYPEVSRRLRQQGRVKVRFRIERSGRVMAAEVVEQSSFVQLNSAAQRLIEDIRFFRPFPADVKETTWLFTVPIEYRM